MDRHEDPNRPQAAPAPAYFRSLLAFRPFAHSTMEPGHP